MDEMNFTETENRIYEEILKNVKQHKKKTVVQIAEKVDVAPSYVIKVAKKLGYSGLNEMWYSLSGIYTDSVSVSLDDFDLMEKNLLDVHVQILCDMLINYRNERIIVNSIGDSDYVGTYLLDKLWHRGFNAMPYKSQLLDQARCLKPGMLIAINESGVVLLEQCLKARKHNYNFVSITSNRNSPLACNSHLTIELRNKKSNFYNYNPNFFTAYVLIFIEILFARYDEEIEKYYKENEEI